MKILRVRRGFTTNSSASSEWLPPTSTSTASSSNPSTVVTTTTSVNNTPRSTPWDATGQEQAAREANLLRLGGLIAFVAVAFVVERAMRLFIKKRNEKRDL